MAATPTPSSSGRRAARGPVPGPPSPSPSPVSPTRLSRLQEKDELRHLNDRLANYIERVRALEADKALLRLQLEDRTEVAGREVAGLRLLYETELADARKLLDRTANERARLQMELGKVREDHRQLQARNGKKETDLCLAQNQLRDVESRLNSKEAELATALSGTKSVEGQLQDVKTQLAALECSLSDTTQQMHDEMLSRVDLENKMQTLREQMAFENSIYEQEVGELRKRHETKIVEIDSGRRTEFESKLAQALQELRKDHEEHIAEYKEQLERTFSAKLENAELSAAKNSDYVSAAREEIKETQLRVDTLTSQLSQCHKQNSELENKARELQEMSDRAHDLHRRQMSEKDRQVSEMRHRLQAQLEDYEHLLDVKLALDMEINAYRKMLEGEEQRLRLSPGSSKRSPVSRTSTSPTGRILRGKRKLEGSETAEGRRGYKIVQQASSTGRVAVDEIDPQGKFVRLLNNSQEDQQLHGWGLRRRHASLPETVYKFPSRFVLKSSQHVTIWAAGAGAVHTLPSDLVWKAQQSWGTGDDMKVTLLDVDGEESADRAIYRIRRGEDESEEDLFEEAITESPFHSQSVDPSCSVM